MADSNEVWKPVVGFEGYEVSDHGRVRSVDRVVTVQHVGGREYERTYPGRLLAPRRDLYGYSVLALRRGGTTHHTRVHRLVLEAFVGPAPEGKPYGLHWDDDPTNNHVSNLRWGSNSDNVHDQVRNGNHYAAARSNCPHGHEYTPENTYLHPEGYRVCKPCRRVYMREYRERLKYGGTPPRTHCKKGHEYTPENTFQDHKGYPACRECKRESQRAYRTRLRQARAQQKPNTTGEAAA